MYVAALAPSPYWLDSSELAAAAWHLGVAHPPGHPLPSLLGKACALLPLGSIAMKVGFASALAGAAAAAQTARLGRLVARRVRTHVGGNAASAPGAERIDLILGAAAGLTFALSYAAAFQAVRPEVYALSTLLVLSTALALARYDDEGDPRQLYLAALFGGLALSNHHLLALTFLIPAAVFVALHPARGRFSRLLALGALGLAPYVYLPLRAARHCFIDWGAPTTWSRFFWVVSARAFQKSVENGTSTDLSGVMLALAAQLHVVGLLLALGGLYVMLRAPSLRRVGLLLAGACALGAGARALVGFDIANPDAYGYLEATVALCAVAAVALPAALVGMRAHTHRELRWATGAALALALAGTAYGASGWSRFALSSDRDLARIVGGWLDRAPPRALFVTSYFQSIYGLGYLQGVEGARPDVDVAHRHFLFYPGYRDELVRRRPKLAGILGPNDLDPAGLAALAELDRPLVLEYDLDLPLGLARRAEVVPIDGELPEEVQGRRFAAWQIFLRADQACRLGDAAAIGPALGAAHAMFGDSPELARLLARCRPNLRPPDRR